MISSKTTQSFEKFLKKPKKDKPMSKKDYKKMDELGRGYEAVILAKKNGK